jgi:hypothetical protein
VAHVRAFDGAVHAERDASKISGGHRGPVFSHRDNGAEDTEGTGTEDAEGTGTEDAEETGTEDAEETGTEDTEETGNTEKRSNGGHATGPHSGQ